ncbi:hypothetical protein Hanom_Chr01g00077651 [Helianthus anomalus]
MGGISKVLHAAKVTLFGVALQQARYYCNLQLLSHRRFFHFQHNFQTLVGIEISTTI